MLLIENLIKGVEEKYIPMLKEVNIPDFTKCIAELSGLAINQICDDVIKDYLITWAKNKYRFYELLGNKIKLDQPFAFKKFREDIEKELSDLEKEFPVYCLWLEEFEKLKSNSIVMSELSWSIRHTIRKVFPNCKCENYSLTGFFKRMLNAPDELVTKLGRIFENDTIQATHTISIDPVDMMLASENPYDWNSCYRLHSYNCDSHADGCLAAVLDNSSLITYVWGREGKLDIYNRYSFKCVRYKRMRQWIALSPKMTTIHFNKIYPSENTYTEQLEKELRIVVETVVANFLGLKNLWKRATESEYSKSTERDYLYGYNEFSKDKMYLQSGSVLEDIRVYTEKIPCACGCGTILDGSDDDVNYLGEGFNCEGFGNGHWCDYIEDYCPDGACCAEDCSECEAWQNNHPVCEYDETEECEYPDWDYVRHGIMYAEESHCSGCPRWESCHMPDEDDRDEE